MLKATFRAVFAAGLIIDRSIDRDGSGHHLLPAGALCLDTAPVHLVAGWRGDRFSPNASVPTQVRLLGQKSWSSEETRLPDCPADPEGVQPCGQPEARLAAPALGLCLSSHAEADHGMADPSVASFSSTASSSCSSCPRCCSASRPMLR
jgi:hypothetical protein